MKKIALELQPCCGNPSGIGLYTYELAKRMKDEDGLEFCGNLFNFLGRNDNTASLQGITMPIRTCSLFPYGVYRRIWDKVPIQYQSLFLGHADLNVFFNYIVPPRVDGRVMTTVYDMTYLRFPETMEARNLKRLQKGMEHSIRCSDHILTISEFSKKEIVELLGIPAEKISVVPCAPSLTGTPAEFPETAEKYGIEKPYLLYVGTIEPRKNLVRLLNAFSILKEKHHIPHQLVLAGGTGWNNEKIMETARNVTGHEDIVFTGYISAAEKYALYQNAEVFVFPSLYEGFGMPPLEAMHFGCPVVCAHAASLPEVVGEAACLVNPMDTQEISAGIHRVLSDREYAVQLKAAGKQQIEKYTWTASAQKLTEACRAVLGEK